MVYCFLADGFEELEAIAPIDMIKRGGIDIKTVGVTGKTVIGSHGISVVSDINLDEIVLDDNLQAIILPGGLPGATNLESNTQVQEAIDFAVSKGALVCAICAAPQILGHKRLLENRSAIAYPGFEKELFGAVISKEYVVADGNFITAKGAGVATEFGLAIVAALKGHEASEQIRAAIQMK